MRAFEGQRSDNHPIKRDARAKRAQLDTLKARLATMKSHESPALRQSMEKKIAELEAERGGKQGRCRLRACTQNRTRSRDCQCLGITTRCRRGGARPGKRQDCRSGL